MNFIQGTPAPVAQILYTDRLLLVPFTLASATSLLEGKLEVLAELGLRTGGNWPDDEALETLPKIIRNLEQEAQPTGFESYMIVLKSNNDVIGDAGFKGRPDAQGAIDLGYAIIADQQRRGYGFETARALTMWALAQHEVSCITARCLIGNAASARVLEKLGMQETGRGSGMIYWKIGRLDP